MAWGFGVVGFRGACLPLVCVGVLAACGGTSDGEGSSNTGSSGGSGGSSSATGGTASGGTSSGGSVGAGTRLGTQSGVVAEFDPAPALSPPIPGCNDTPSDCGGDPTGSWHMIELCGASSDCPGYNFHHTRTGRITFTADGTYETASGVTTMSSLTPLACDELAEGCTLIEDCAVENDACQCEFTFDDNGGQGQWATLGNQLRLVNLDDATVPRQFTLCVQGNRLQIWSYADDNVTAIQVFERE